MDARKSVLLLVPAILAALTSQILAQKDACKNGALFAYDLEDCHHFYACVATIPVRMTCPQDLVFSLSDKACVFRKDLQSKGCLSAGGNFKSLSEADNDDDDSTKETETTSEMVEAENSDQKNESLHDSDMYEKMSKKNKSLADYKEMDEYKKKFSATADPQLDAIQTLEKALDDMDDYNYKDKFNGIAIEPRCHGDATIVPHKTLCHRYFDCTKPHMDDMNRYLTPYEYECPYPKQFSQTTMQCEDFDSVDCGDRMEYMDPCEYSENMCSGPNCAPCTVDHASCIGYPDGLMYWPGREGSGFWVECRNQRTVSQGNCGMDDHGMMRIFSTKFKKCVSYSKIIDEVCYWTSNTLPHPSECHLYYDCTMHSEDKSESMSSLDYLRGCPYPKFYSVRTGQCEDYDQVSCGARRQAKTPCDYIDCIDPDFGSCEGMENGPNAFRTREGTAHYVTCKDERTVSKEICPVDKKGLYMQFAPGLHLCVPLL